MSEPSPADPSTPSPFLEHARSGPDRLRALCADLAEDDVHRKPGVGKLSVFEHVCHMAGMETRIFAKRLTLVLTEDRPQVKPVTGDPFADDEEFEGRPLAEILDEFATRRAANVALVEGTDAEHWTRPYVHPGRGETDFAGLVEHWSKHDADHLRQIDIIVRNCRERNL